MMSRVTTALASALLAVTALAGPRLQKVEVDTTDTATIGSGGVLRLEGGLGDLNVETWDGPNVQISVARIRYADDADKAAFEKDLKEITVTVKQSGANATVTTQFPRRSFWIKLLKGRTSADIEYRIQVPRGTNLAIDHGEGAIVLADTGGNLDVQMDHGDIVALLAPGDYQIEAHSRFGRVDSDFAGAFHHKRIVGENYNAKDSGAHRVNLRVKCGNIAIQQALQFKYS